MKHYFHIQEDLSMDELTAGEDAQTIHIEVSNKGEAIALLAQYEHIFTAGGKPYVKEFRTNKHAEKLLCTKEDL